MMRFWKRYMDEAMNDSMRAHVQTYLQRFQKEQHPNNALFADSGDPDLTPEDDSTEASTFGVESAPPDGGSGDTTTLAETVEVPQEVSQKRQGKTDDMAQAKRPKGEGEEPL